MGKFEGKSVAANLFRGIEAVGGKLLFGEEYMRFKSHFFNIQRGETIIYYNDIVRIEKIKTLGIIPNGINVVVKTLEGEKEYKFVINKRNKIVEFLLSKINS